MSSIRCRIQDRNHDGVVDLVVAAEALGLGSCPGWRIISGADGAVLEHHDWSALPEDSLDSRVRAYSLVGLPSVEIRGAPMKSILALSHYTRYTSRPGVVLLFAEKGVLIRRIERP